MAKRTRVLHSHPVFPRPCRWKGFFPLVEATAPAPDLQALPSPQSGALWDPTQYELTLEWKRLHWARRWGVQIKEGVTVRCWVVAADSIQTSAAGWPLGNAGELAIPGGLGVKAACSLA